MGPAASQALVRWTTPQLLQGSLYLTWGVSALLLLVTLFGVQQQRHSIKTVGKDTTPSIIAAQHIKAALADMDANVANELLAQPGENLEAVKTSEERRQEAIKALVA